MSTLGPANPALVPTIDAEVVLSAIKSFNPHSGAGPSGNFFCGSRDPNAPRKTPITQQSLKRPRDTPRNNVVFMKRVNVGTEAYPLPRREKKKTNK